MKPTPLIKKVQAKYDVPEEIIISDFEQYINELGPAKTRDFLLNKYSEEYEEKEGRGKVKLAGIRPDRKTFPDAKIQPEEPKNKKVRNSMPINARRQDDLEKENVSKEKLQVKIKATIEATPCDDCPGQDECQSKKVVEKIVEKVEVVEAPKPKKKRTYKKRVKKEPKTTA